MSVVYDHDPMPVHVAILLRPYIEMILDGRKTIESRLTVTARPPYRAIRGGERIYFKASSGPYMATALAGKTEFYENLTRPQVAGLCKRYNHEVCGDKAYWQWKKDSRYATFITLRDVEPTSAGPAMQPSKGIAWFVLDESVSAPEKQETFEIALTGGAIRNGYVRVAEHQRHFPGNAFGGKTLAEAGQPITLELPHGDCINTDIVSNGMIRWRGWRRHFADERVLAGDRVRFVRTAARRYRVTFIASDQRGL